MQFLYKFKVLLHILCKLNFSFTTFSTVGYGDISPKTDLTKLIVLSQQIILLLDLEILAWIIFFFGGGKIISNLSLVFIFFDDS